MRRVYFVKVEVTGAAPFFRGIWNSIEEVQRWASDYRDAEAKPDRKITITVEVMHVMSSMLAGGRA